MNMPTYSHELITKGAKVAEEVGEQLNEITSTVSEIKLELEDEYRDYDAAINSVKKIRGTADRLKESLKSLEDIDAKLEHLKTKALL